MGPRGSRCRRSKCGGGRSRTVHNDLIAAADGDGEDNDLATERGFFG
jgi:hypothetical protein